jgi:hypothetical protein
MNSDDFEYPGTPDQLAPFQKLHPQSNGNYYFNQNSFTENATVAPFRLPRADSAGTALLNCTDSDGLWLLRS